MPKELCLEARERLEKMSEEYLEDQRCARDPDDERDARVVACCIAVAVEELEKFIYGNDWTPSVVPYREGKEWEWPGENDEDMSGPPWDRRGKSREEKFEAKFPTIAKWKKEGKVLERPKKVVLAGHLPTDWSPPETESFKMGNWTGFVRAVRVATQSTLKDVVDYASRMKSEHPDIWGCTK